MAVTHYPRIGKALARGGGYDLVCHGHSHKRIIKQVGETLRVNPGEVMGRFGLSTYAAVRHGHRAGFFRGGSSVTLVADAPGASLAA